MAYYRSHKQNYSKKTGIYSEEINNWIRINSDEKYDKDGKIAQSGLINKIILDQSLDNFFNSEISKKKSFDTKDFDLSFVRGLSIEDGAATLTEFTIPFVLIELNERFPFSKPFINL